MTRTRRATTPPSSVPRVFATAVTAALATAVMVALLVAGCGTGTPPTNDASPARTATTDVPSPTASPSASLTPTPPPTDPAIVFAADGIGPYVIGTTLADLQNRALVTGIADDQTCPGVTTAAATQPYAGRLTVTFIRGRLSSIHTASDTLVTPAGVKVGMPLTQVEAVYGGRGTLLARSDGRKALVVRSPATAFAVTLSLNEDGTAVASMSAGEADTLETVARTGVPC